MHKTYVNCVAFSPDGKRFATGSTDKTVRIWNSATGDLESTLSSHKGAVWNLAFSPDGRLLAISGEDGELVLHDARPPYEARGRLEGMSTPSQAVAFSPDGKLLAAAELGDEPGVSGTVRIWDVPRRKTTSVRS